jgi:hypothetical protein
MEEEEEEENKAQKCRERNTQLMIIQFIFIGKF